MPAKFAIVVTPAPIPAAPEDNDKTAAMAARVVSGPVSGRSGWRSLLEDLLAGDVMLSAKVEFIGAIQHADGVSWQHFRCPDGTMSEIIGPGKAPARP